MSTQGNPHILARHNTCVETSHGLSLYESSYLLLPQRWGECRTSCTQLMQMDTIPPNERLMVQDFALVCLDPGNVTYFQVRE